ncbi:hypothetical protein AYO21_03766 [Fonsecaea monophora]|uniref:Uncharacterized protein n=1 Tax=Fonsecaea monophora TaxID=254056 RepID=A0A177FE55_9EURO|nr:hypothetical protein AYO21_03766 [Fonsecaea monophora]KAH0828206.1 hypothetical protein FOPE_00278 [Fonsecaea pedrosoi]OAG42031.1 hypothetical protein AYO21_03766 [Fonsecaea monophora]
MVMIPNTELGDGGSDGGGAVHQWSLEDSSPSSEVQHSYSLLHSDDYVALFTNIASHEFKTAVDEFLAPLDDDKECHGGVDIDRGIDEFKPPTVNKEVQNEEPSDADLLPFVAIEQYIPGVNDLMSGAVSLLDKTSTDMTQDDNIMCMHGLERRLMPFKVLPQRDLFGLGLPFADESSLCELPSGFLTTVRGLERAVGEFYASNPDVFADDIESDVALLGMIAKRGGLARTKFQQVVYPEEIVPLDDPDLVLKENFESSGGEQDDQDKEYWAELQEQGRIWDELYIP